MGRAKQNRKRAHERKWRETMKRAIGEDGDALVRWLADWKQVMGGEGRATTATAAEAMGWTEERAAYVFGRLYAAGLVDRFESS